MFVNINVKMVKIHRCELYTVLNLWYMNTEIVSTVKQKQDQNILQWPYIDSNLAVFCACAGWFILGVTAVDPDSGLNGQVKYSLVGSADNSKFTIEEDTGIILAAQDLTSSSGGFEIHVRATDMGVNRTSMHISCMYTLTILN